MMLDARCEQIVNKPQKIVRVVTYEPYLAWPEAAPDLIPQAKAARLNP